MKHRTLTPRHQRFIAEFLKDHNEKRALEAAGYSPTTHVLKTAAVRAALQEAVERQSRRLQATADEARERNCCIMRFDPADLFDEHGQLLPVPLMPRHARLALKSIEVIKRNLTSGDDAMETTYRVQFLDKLKAIELEYKHFGLLEETVEHRGEIQIRWLKPGE